MLARSRRSPAINWYREPHCPDQDRLEHAVLAQRVGQRGDLARVELPAWLKRIGVDLIDGDLDQLGLFERAGLEPAFIAAQQCFQSASETSLIHGR